MSNLKKMISREHREEDAKAKGQAGAAAYGRRLKEKERVCNASCRWLMSGEDDTGVRCGVVSKDTYALWAGIDATF